MDGILISAAFVAVTVLAVGVVLTWRGMRWGSTAAERTAAMPGDGYLAGGSARRVAMTRAVSIDAPPEVVWPWLAQVGRGAGWYSFDRLDNGGLVSAEHIVSWVPAPQLGDASAIGYLRDLEPGSGLTWWVPGTSFVGARCRLVVDIQLRAVGQGSRLSIRMSADASGAAARLALGVFSVIDSIMACRQLVGIRDRVERYGARNDDPGRAESGSCAQFQTYEVVYASGERAGVPGQDDAERWHRAAVADGVVGQS